MHACPTPKPCAFFLRTTVPTNQPPAVGNLYAHVSKFTPGVAFTLSGGVPPKPLTDLHATLAQAALLNVMVRDD